MMPNLPSGPTHSPSSVPSSSSSSTTTGPTAARLIDFNVTGFEAPGTHTATVIFLHGLGGEGENLIPAVEGLRQRLSPELASGVKFLLPNAPPMKVTGNGGYVMQSWFDVYNFDIENREEDAVGLAGAADWLNAFVDREVEEFGIPPERVIVGGLSQGGAVVCRALVGSERRLGGAFMLCSYVPLRRRVLEMKTPFASQIPLFWGHGIMDAQVTFPLALRSAKQLALDLETTFLRTSHPLTPESLQEDFKRQSEGTGKSSNSSAAGKATLRFCYYGDLGHWFSEEEISDLAVWMNGILGNGRYKEVGGVGEAEGEEEGEAGMDVDDG